MADLDNPTKQSLEEDSEGQNIQSSADNYSDDFNLEKGVDRTYEYKCNLGIAPHPDI